MPSHFPALSPCYVNRSKSMRFLPLLIIIFLPFGAFHPLDPTYFRSFFVRCTSLLLFFLCIFARCLFSTGSLAAINGPASPPHFPSLRARNFLICVLAVALSHFHHTLTIFLSFSVAGKYVSIYCLFPTKYCNNVIIWDVKKMCAIKSNYYCLIIHFLQI